MEGTQQRIVQERLQSHLIPIPELANGGYEGLGDDAKNEKLKSDFDAFVKRRAELVLLALQKLCDGHQLSITELFDFGTSV